jgi:peptidoglycan hydrolase-like protein with peptidoglycan-binding domain
MKRTPLFIVIAALASAPAWAGNDSPQSQSEQQSAPQAQATQSGAQQSQSSETVKQAQEKLSAAGYDVGTADGVMGPKTQDAIKQLQQDKQLNATGELDQETLAALGVNEENSSTGSSSAGSSSSPSGDSSSSQNATGSSGGDSANGGASQPSGASQ